MDFSSIYYYSREIGGWGRMLNKFHEISPGGRESQKIKKTTHVIYGRPLRKSLYIIKCDIKRVWLRKKFYKSVNRMAFAHELPC